jgi:hypothetical protein
MAPGGGFETLTRPEILKALRALSDEEKTALLKIAALYARATPYDAMDLFNEAVCRLLSGERKWPKGLPALVVIGGVIRSIAWSWRTRKIPSDDPTELDGAPMAPSQESATDLAQFIAWMVDRLKDDAVALAVLPRIMVGDKGKELLPPIAAILNSDAHVAARGGRKATEAELARELDRIQTRIRRLIEKHCQEGEAK